MIPSFGMRPNVGFIVNTAALFAGIERLPDVSVPAEIRAKSAATAMVDPEDDPPAFCSVLAFTL